MTEHSRKTQFEGAVGALSGILELPHGRPRAYALFAHCFSCSKDVRAAREVARALRAEGYAVLRFDFTGLGGSAGDFSDTNFSSNVADLLKAYDYLAHEFEAPKIVIGHSLGGAAAIVAGKDMPAVNGVATIGAPAETRHVAHQFQERVSDIETHGAAEVSLAGRPFVIKRQFLDDLDTDRVLAAAAQLKKPLLVLHAPRDATVGVENAGAIFAAAKHPKSFVSLDTADHLLTDPSDARYAARVIAAWASRFVAAEGEATAAPAPISEGVAIARTAKETRFGADVFVDGFALRADAAKADGGDETGPTPTALVKAALAACSTVTLRMYAERKGWPVDGLAVTVSARAGEDAHVVRHFEKVVELPAALSDVQRQRLLEISSRCPVHRILAEEVEIAQRLA